MDLCFANESNRMMIQQLYPAYQFQVEVDTFQLKNTQSYTFALEKLENCIQLRIVDSLNQNRMFLCTIGKLVLSRLQ